MSKLDTAANKIVKATMRSNKEADRREKAIEVYLEAEWSKRREEVKELIKEFGSPLVEGKEYRKIEKEVGRCLSVDQYMSLPVDLCDHIDDEIIYEIESPE